MAVLKNERASRPVGESASRPSLRRSRLWFGLGIFAAIALLFHPPPLGAQTDNSSLIAAGVVTPIEEATLGAKIKGIIQKFNVEEGSLVKKGDVLVELDHDLEELDVQRQDRVREAARLAAEKSKRDFENSRKLWDQKAVSEDEFRKFDLQYQIDSRQAEQADIQYRMAKQRLEDNFLRSPFDGIVVRKLKQRGEPVDELEKVLKVVNISRLNLVIYLDGKFLPRVRLGQSAQVECDTMGKQIVFGKVAVMDPVVDAASGQFRVKIQFDNPSNEIKAGINGTATLLEGKDVPAAVK
jgi:RND family efflux transporter MFP subunit